MDKTKAVINQFDEYIMPTYGRYPLAEKQAKGVKAIDEDGKSYIDFGSGIGTNSLGFCDEQWTDAVCRQVKQLQHISNYYYGAISGDFAKRLCDFTGYSKIFYGNSGAEANECAIKLSRKYSYDKYGKDAASYKRYKIITLVNSFHGRTMATLSATGQDVFHTNFFPFLEGFDYAIANNIDDLKSKIDDDVCAIMIEYVQGEGGVIALEQAFVDAVFELAEQHDLLVISDEVQTGAGRTGKFLAGEHFGKKADVVTLAKGIGGGLPIGICMANEKCANTLGKGHHGSTFGGNPVSCAGGLAVLDRMQSEGFLDSVAEKAAYFKEKLLAIDEVEAVSGLGLMIGITLKTKKSTDVVSEALEKGLLLLTAKEKVRLLPPLTITYDEIDEGMAILKEILC